MKSRRVLYLLLVLSALFTLNSTVLALRNVNRLRQRSDEPIQSWMSIPYIAHAYHVPTVVVAAAIGIDDQRRDRRPIGKIAQQQGVPLSTLVERILTAVEQFRTPPDPPRAPLP